MIDVAVAFARTELAAIADPARATPMAAYLKTDMAFYGVTAPLRRRVSGQLAKRFPPDSRLQYESVVRALWGLAHREEKYLAIDYAERFKVHIVPDSVPLYRDLIVSGAWWDFVDPVAAHLVGVVLRTRREVLTPTIVAWGSHDDLWLRRTALICQLGHKADTDVALLFDLCRSLAPEKEFFIRKAIGWALRDYARTDPDAVRRFLVDNHDRLSGLSYREAAKHLPDMLEARRS
ncbi:MAG: DNA alkylation repair protein [Acidimicrobiia bacterium]|nr:DNA alkylation repair protein [Acidimicrobiia bacterium]